jgi:hypothetical protein
MEFQTKIVTGNKNPKARIVWVGGALLFLAMILTCIGQYQRYGLWLFGIAVVVLVLGAVLARGDVDIIDVSAVDIVINTEEIRVGETSYRVSEVTDIVFQVEGYEGMVDPDGYVERGYASRVRGLLNGMNNYLDFKIGGEKVEWQFYLPDPQHVQQLGALFKEWYAKRIPFLERGVTSKRTFLFEPVTKKEWEDRMIENGYV